MLDTLSASIAEVAPIHGVSVGNRNDKSTWRVDFKPDATDQQKAAAQAVVNAFVFSRPTPAMVDAERDRRLQTLAFGGHVYDFCDSKESDKNIAGASTLALAAIVKGAQPNDLRWANPDRDFVWIAHDNTLVSMDAQTTLAFGMHAAEWKAAHIYAARSLKDMSQIPADFSNNSRWPS